MIINNRKVGKPPMTARHRKIVLLCALFTGLNLAWYLTLFGLNASSRFRGLFKVRLSGFEVDESQDSSLKGSHFPSSLYEKSITKTDLLLKGLANKYRPPVSGYYIHPRVNRTAHPGTPKGSKMNSVLEMAEAVLRGPTLKVYSPCGGNQGQGLKAVVFLFCNARDYQRRRVIRETYGGALKNNSQTAVYFVFGQSGNPNDDATLISESSLYNDILQFQFSDTYHNLTLKAVATIRWAALHCSRAAFAFKLDFDCYIRVKPFLEILEYIGKSASKSGTSLGTYGMPPMRQHSLHENGGKWNIDYLYYPYERYPLYNGGPYLLSVDKLPLLYRAVASSPTTETLPSLPFDDVYVTGILAEKANISRHMLPGIRMPGKEAKRDRAEMDRAIVIFQDLTDADLRWFWRVYGQN